MANKEHWKSVVGYEVLKRLTRTDLEFANALNSFYNRFDTTAFSGEIQDLQHKLDDNQHFCINQRDVEKAFLSVKVNKSSGPDNICGRVLKFCAKELSPVFHCIFNMSLSVQHVPSVWKDAVVVSVPKLGCPKMLNDLRPVALTSVVMTFFERFLTNKTQRVRINNTFSGQVTSSTGSPQGCVLSSLLFILYTNMCQSNWENCTILKYVDDTVIVSLLQNGETGHGPAISDFVEWCEKSYLHFNVLKTKDMIMILERTFPCIRLHTLRVKL